MSDGNYLAAEHMPEGLEDWQTVEVYCRSWASGMKAGRWQRWMVDNIKPWHVWRYKAPNPSEGMMAKAAAMRERMEVVALKGNGFYVLRADYPDGEVEA